MLTRNQSVRKGGRDTEKVARSSQLDPSGLPLQEVELRLATLRSLTRRMFAAALTLTAVAAATALVSSRVAISFGVAAAAAFIVATGARLRGRALVSRLLWVRAAYRLDVVRAAGSEFATPQRCRRLAAGLRRVVAFGDGEFALPGYIASLDERVLERRGRLLALAEAFESPRPIHPASVALLHRLLTLPASSPLYNPALGEDLLDLTLHEVESGLEGALR
jgi:hypothetical protein